MSTQILYFIGLFLAMLYLVMGFDDFIWDLVTLTFRRRYRKQRLDFKELNSRPPKLLALAVAAWHEDNVLGDVISNIVESTDYPKSMYHIFLGVYPNDAASIQVARTLEKTYSNIHVVINDTPGPTSKAQNLNYVIQQIQVFEQEKGLKFAALTIHDSEDVVHPLELKVTNYLLETHEAMQFPVFPMMRMPKFSNFFQNLTTGTYADEFAENHFSTMVSRYTAKAFVPSAGTGFTLSRETLESFGKDYVLPKDSLTEDYRLSLTLYEKGIEMYYVLEKVPRINKNGKLTWDFVTTRSIFPNTFKAAVKQKARWILGITMQSFRFRDIFQMKGIRFSGRYSLYKDLKAKIGNLLVLVGYPVLVYFLVSLFVPLTPIYPKGTLSWYLCLIVTVMMIERQLFRSVAIYNVYGMRSVFFACLFPPLLPIRMVWGNIINLTATIKAYKQRLFETDQKKKQLLSEEIRHNETDEENAREMDKGLSESLQKDSLTKQQKDAPTSEKKMNVEKKEQKGFAWSKTDHEFLERRILRNYYRTTGDILLQKGYISANQLKQALKETREKDERIGTYLIRKGMINEEELLDTLSEVKHIQYIYSGNLEDFSLWQYASSFEEQLLRRLSVLPVIRVCGGYVIAFCEESPEKAQTILKEQYGIGVQAAFLSTEAVKKGLDLMYGKEKTEIPAYRMIQTMTEQGRISAEQAIILRNYHYRLGIPETKLLEIMGLNQQKEFDNCISVEEKT